MINWKEAFKDEQLFNLIYEAAVNISRRRNAEKVDSEGVDMMIDGYRVQMSASDCRKFHPIN